MNLPRCQTFDLNAKRFVVSTARLWLLVFLFQSFVGCGPLEGDVPVEVVFFDDDEDDFVIGVQELHSVKNILTGENNDFNVLGAPKVPGLDGIEILSNRQDFPTEADVVTENRKRAGGELVRPRLHWDGTAWVAQDFDSLQYLTYTFNFERVFSFFSNYDDTGATSDLATVGFYGEVTFASLFPLPVIASDNAAYYPPMDGWLVLRSTPITSGIPMGMNDAVIAHEFSHRFFHHNVFLPSFEAFDLWRTFNGQGAAEGNEALSVLQLKGIDEGLADVFAIGYSGSTHFIGRSIVIDDPKITSRNVEGPFADVVTFEHILSGNYPDDHEDACGGGLTSPIGFNFYCIGTLFARVAWDSVGGDVEALRESFLPAMAPALARTSILILAASTGGELAFDLSMVLEPIAQELPPDVRNRFCAGVREKFSFFVYESSSVPTCF
ncbi:MAG: hypothetical protein GY822_21600 [Deltaproteobacteria bacterium]|nr:hypothetical protein [Deltaproteobacteria bacterium]